MVALYRVCIEAMEASNELMPSDSCERLNPEDYNISGITF